MTNATPLLQVTDLVVEFATSRGRVRAVDGVSFGVGRGECLAIVGESGSGKTQVLNACLGLLAGNGRARGEVTFDGRSLLGLDEAAHNAIRGTGIALLSQDPLGALTPHLRIETQLVEGLLDRGLATSRDARDRALRALREVNVPEPEARLRQYPHELSGGMRQRVALAIALMCDPPLLFADEPTTALDASVQARVLASLARLPVIDGQPPRPGDIERGCAFAPRCEHAIAGPCRTEVPRVESDQAGTRQVACHLADLGGRRR